MKKMLSSNSRNYAHPPMDDNDDDDLCVCVDMDLIRMNVRMVYV
jgi:hypothetical protein